MERSTRVVLLGSLALAALLTAALLPRSAPEAVRSVRLARAPFNQPRSDERQRALLDGALHSRVPHGDGARVFVRAATWLKLPVGYRDLRIGSTFRLGEKHFSYRYRVEEIDAGGIGFAYDGSEHSYAEGDYSGPVQGKFR